ncbi:unnamed protein product [Toxocara canis]|uniref:Protein kinase domain-containing protein n=1 Tax=Toxocara canis TaxID=6265 RepID=A0A183V2I3_TOXCA|nr:unnamed protein product [Toxocara canis]
MPVRFYLFTQPGNISAFQPSSSCCVGGEEDDTNYALPQVGQTIEHRKYKFKILRQIWSGPFSNVFVIVDAIRNKKYAMKIERELDGRSALKLDVFVLKEFQNKKTPGFPRFIAAGRTNHLKYLVLQLVGPDINKLRRCLPGKKFCLSTALRLCQQTLKRIETLHDAGWLSRDIKASNFTVGRTKDSGTVYMLDFGFARRFRDRKGHAYAPSRSAALLGSIYYASMAAHAFRDQCRRDDVESWFYMSCELIKGPLPWASLDPKTDYNLIGEWKRYARFGGREELLRDLNRNAPFEWQCDPFLVQKAAMIGDQGKSQEISYRIRPGSTSDNVEVVSCNTSLEMMELIKDQCQSTEVNATACSNEQQTITSKVD